MGNSFYLFCGCVQQSSVGVIERWGRFEKLAQPGFHLFNPFAGECLAGVLSTRISSLDVRIETKTKVTQPPTTKTLASPLSFSRTCLVFAIILLLSQFVLFLLNFCVCNHVSSVVNSVPFNRFCKSFHFPKKPFSIFSLKHSKHCSSYWDCFFSYCFFLHHALN